MEFWLSQQAKPELDNDWACWLAQQVCGLAGGLSSIHHATVSIRELQQMGLPMPNADGAEDEEKDFGRHGDIKPVNILWFRDERNRWHHGVLKITDFGLTAFHREHTTKVLKDLVPGMTLTYMAPEYDMNKSISRPYDVWSLGCVYLEFATWAILGGQAVSEFAARRRKERDAKDNEKFDTFYGLQRRLRAHAKLKNCVIRVGHTISSPCVTCS